MSMRPGRSWTPWPVAGADLADRLAAEGLIDRRTPVPFEPLELARRLRRALALLGPVPRAFGRHLATRIDLLPAAACLELSALPSDAEPLPAETFLQRLGIELGRPVGEVFRVIDPRPRESAACRQRHRARTVAGEAVEVVLVRSEAAASSSPEALAPLAAVLGAAGLPGRDVVRQFHGLILEELDLNADAEALSELAGDAESLDQLTVPAVRRDLSGRGVLVQSASVGLGLDQLRFLDPSVRSDALRRVALVWLRQALFGRAFPLALDEGRVRVLDDGRVAVVGGPFRTLPHAARDNLWSYFEEALDLDPSSACDRLLPELVAGEKAASEAELLVRLRQVVPFRDGGFGRGADPLADGLVVSLHVARECGYRLRRPSAELTRGLVAIAIAALDGPPRSAPLTSALEELRMLRSAGELRRAFDVADLSALPASYTALMLELPRKLDALLDRFARGEARVQLRLDEARGTSRSGGFGASAVVLATVTGALLLSAPRLREVAAADGGGWFLLLLLAMLLAASLGWRR